MENVERLTRENQGERKERQRQRLTERQSNLSPELPCILEAFWLGHIPSLPILKEASVILHSS